MMRAESRGSQRGVTAVEAAIVIALGGSLLAIAVPAFVRNMSSSRLVEPTAGLARIGEHAIANAAGKACSDAFPASAPLTPEAVPRGKPAVDPASPDPWQHPTWTALDFRASPPGVAHSFSFAFDATSPALGTSGDTSFVAHAHGDLDGDGTTSTFEVHGQCASATHAATLAPEMIVESELE